MQDIIDRVMRHARSGATPDDYNMYMQTLLVDQLISLSNVRSKPGSSSSAASSGSSFSLVEFSRISPDAITFPVMMQMLSEDDQISANQYHSQLTGIRYERAPDKSHIWYGMLLDVRKTIDNAARTAKTDELKSHYGYLSHQIGKALKTD